VGGRSEEKFGEDWVKRMERTEMGESHPAIDQTKTMKSWLFSTHEGVLSTPVDSRFGLGMGLISMISHGYKQGIPFPVMAGSWDLFGYWSCW